MNDSPPSPSPAGAVLITGATSGLGRRVAETLVARGRSVVIGGRRADAVARLVDQLNDAAPGSASGFVADLADLEELRAAIAGTPLLPLHGIFANAGLTLDAPARSAQGYELTFAVNVLAHELLLAELGDTVLEGGRIVITSSGVHDPSNKLARRAGIPVPNWTGTRHLACPDDAPAEAVLDDGRLRYSTSKLGNVLQARSLQRRLREAGRSVDVFAIDPGLMVDTELARELPSPIRAMFRVLGRIATPFVDNMRLSTTTAEIVGDLFEVDAYAGRGFAYFDGATERPPSPDAQRDDLLADFEREAPGLIAA